MAGKIRFYRGRMPLFLLPLLLLLLVLLFGLFAVFGVTVLAVAAALGLGASVFRKLFSGGKKKTASADDTEGGLITLGKDDYEVSDVGSESDDR